MPLLGHITVSPLVERVDRENAGTIWEKVYQMAKGGSLTILNKIWI